MTEAVGQRWRELPAVSRLGRWVGSGNDRDLVWQHQVANGPLEHNPQERGLDRRRRGRDLVKESQAGSGSGERTCPRWRSEFDLRTAGPVTIDDWQPGEVGGLADRRDHRLARQLGRGGQRADHRCLAGPRCSPEQHRHPRRNRDPERLTCHRLTVHSQECCVLLSGCAVMDVFDAETYLRMLGERVLLDRDRQHQRRSPLDLPASALVFAGLIDADDAARVIDDHTTALGVRSGERGFPHFGPPNRRRSRGNLESRETMVLDHELAFADGLLLIRDLAITPSGATLRFRWRSNAGRSRGRGRMFGIGGPTFPWGAAAPVIEDDQGNRPTVASSGGGGNDSQWDGELQLHGSALTDDRVAPDRGHTDRT